RADAVAPIPTSRSLAWHRSRSSTALASGTHLGAGNKPSIALFGAIAPDPARPIKRGLRCSALDARESEPATERRAGAKVAEVAVNSKIFLGRARAGREHAARPARSSS